MKATWMLAPALFVAATLALAGCTPSGQTVVPTPDLTTVEEGTSDLESNPWVEGARASDLGYRLAANSLDFTIEQYTSTRTPAIAITEFDGWKTQYIDTGAEPVSYPGPSILLPLSIVETDAGAEVEFCNASGRFELTAGQTEPDYLLTAGRLTTWTLAKVDGVVVVSDQSNSTQECDATGAPVQLFDPLPSTRTSVALGDVRPPLGWTD